VWFTDTQKGAREDKKRESRGRLRRSLKIDAISNLIREKVRREIQCSGRSGGNRWLRLHLVGEAEAEDAKGLDLGRSAGGERDGARQATLVGLAPQIRTSQGMSHLLGKKERLGGRRVCLRNVFMRLWTGNYAEE